MKLLKFLRKFLFWTFSLAILVPVLLSVWLHWFFPGELVKKELTSFVKNKYDLSLDIGQLQVSLFSGITVTDFKFSPDKSGIDSLVSFEKFKLSYKIMPLFSKKLVIDEITVISPRAGLIRTRDGVWNWQLLLNKFKQPPKVQTAKPKSAAPEISFELEAFKVVGLSLFLKDLQTGTIARLQGFNLNISDLLFVNKEKYHANIELDFDKNSLLSLRRPDLYSELLLKNFIINILADPLKIKVDSRIEVLPDKISFKNIHPATPGLITSNFKATYLQPQDSLLINQMNFELGQLADFGGVAAGSKIKSAGRIINLGQGKFNADLGLLFKYVLNSGFLPPDKIPVIIPEGKLTVSGINLIAEPQKKNFGLAADLDCSLKKLSLAKNKLNVSVGLFSMTGKYRVQLDSNRLSLAELPTAILINNLDLNNAKTKLHLERLFLQTNPILTEKFRPEQLQARLEVQNLNGCDISDSLTVILPQILKMPELIKQVRVENRLAIRKIKPVNFVPNLPFGAQISLKQRVSLSNGLFSVNTDFDLTEMLLKIKENQHAIPSQSYQTSVNGSLLGFPDSLQLSNLKVTAGNFAEVSLAKMIYQLKTKQVAISGLNLQAWPDKLISAAGDLPAFFKQQVEINEGVVSASINAKIDLLNKKQQADGSINLILPGLVYNRDVKLSGLNWQEKFSLQNGNIFAEGTVKLGKADFKNKLAPFGLGNYLSEHKISLDQNRTLNLERISLSIQSLGKQIATLKGRVDLKNIYKNLDLTFENELPFKSSYPFIKQIKNLQGSMHNRINISADTASLIKIKQNHHLNSVSLTANLDSSGLKTAKIENLNLKLPINLAYNLDDKRLVSWQNWPLLPADLLVYRANRSAYAANGWPVKNFSIKRVNLNSGKLKLDLNNLESDVYVDNNRLFLNYFYLEIFGGNTDGQFRVILPEQIDSTLKNNIQTAINITASGINTALLNTAGIGSASSELNFSANFKTKGLDFIKNPEIDGNLSITRISDEDAKALLEFLNKGSSDQTLEMLKNTLNYFPGIKLSLFSFQLKNNFIYTLIKLNKPLYLFYFPLAEEIRPSKQSLRFYLDKYVKEK